MKTNNAFYCLLMALLMGIMGCGSGHEDEYTFDQDLVGEWEMEYGNQVEVLPGNSILLFHTDGTLTVKSKSESICDTYFLPTGTYTYSVSKGKVTFSGLEKVFNYRIIKNKLELFFVEENAYPATHLYYVFHKRY